MRERKLCIVLEEREFEVLIIAKKFSNHGCEQVLLKICDLGNNNFALYNFLLTDSPKTIIFFRKCLQEFPRGNQFLRLNLLKIN